MRKRVFVVLLTLIVLFASDGFSQDVSAQKNSWLLGVLFNLEQVRDEAALQIKKAENTIVQARYC